MLELIMVIVSASSVVVQIVAVRVTIKPRPVRKNRRGKHRR